MRTLTIRIVTMGVLVGLTVVAVFGGMLVMARHSGETVQEEFFQAMASGDPEQVLKLCHADLRKEIDPPLLAAWMLGVKEHLGDFKRLSSTDFGTSARIVDGATLFESRGKVFFERGAAQSELTFRSGKLISFNVDSTALPADWFTGPAKSDLYRTRAKDFLERFFNGDARDMMHEALQKKVSHAMLIQQIAKLRNHVGVIERFEYHSEELEIGDTEQLLTVKYLVEGSKGKMEATVTFQLIGLKGHLIAYQWKPSAAS